MTRVLSPSEQQALHVAHMTLEDVAPLLDAGLSVQEVVTLLERISLTAISTREADVQLAADLLNAGFPRSRLLDLRRADFDSLRGLLDDETWQLYDLTEAAQILEERLDGVGDFFDWWRVIEATTSPRQVSALLDACGQMRPSYGAHLRAMGLDYDDIAWFAQTVETRPPMNAEVTGVASLPTPGERRLALTLLSMPHTSNAPPWAVRAIVAGVTERHDEVIRFVMDGMDPEAAIRASRALTASERAVGLAPRSVPSSPARRSAGR